MVNETFLSMFLEEAHDVLQALEAGLMELEAKQDDRAHVDKTFRAAHTLKGAAGMVGLSEIARFTHGVEAVLDRIRAGQLAVSPPIISALLAGKDHLAAAVEAAADGTELTLPEALTARLADLAEGRVTLAEELASVAEPIAPPADVVQAAPPEDRRYLIRFAPSHDLQKLEIDPLGVLDEIRELGRARVTANWDRLPPLEDLDPTRCDLAWTVDLVTPHQPRRIGDAFLFLTDPSQFTIEPIPRADPAQTTDPLPPPPSAAAANDARAKPAIARIRVDSDRLNDLVGMAGELAILTDSLRGLSDLRVATPWRSTLEALDRLGGRLRDATLELRMVPVEELFVRFPRVVRDLADRSGKRIDLKIEGEETQMDRTIIERLSEPMIHLIRNAVDHGLESPEERLAAGKPAAGRLVISAGHEGDRVAIRITDDGRGLDRPRIVRKAIAAGLLPHDTPASDPRVTNVLFEPGFSTRDKAGELSGRGVGLDVVRDVIRGLRGSVTLSSEFGRGTTMLIRLPLTLAMIDGLLVESDGARYVVPMGQVDECVAIGDEATFSTMGRRAGMVRGELVPIVSLRDLLDGFETPPPPGRRELLLTRHAEQRVGLAVDRLLGRVQAVIQPLSDKLSGLKRFSGATILGDGSICLILDLPTVVTEAQAAESTFSSHSPTAFRMNAPETARPHP